MWSGYDHDRPDRVEARGGYYMSDLPLAGGWERDLSEDEVPDCYACEGAGCEECDSEYEREIIQCCGTTQRGTRCQITSESVYSHQRKFADAAERLASGERYCGFHKDQEWMDNVCDECDGAGCRECCLACDGEGCPECCDECDGEGCAECCDDYDKAPPPPVAAPRASAPAAAAPADDEVEVVGSRSRKERDAELLKHAIDVDAEPSVKKPSAKKSPSVPTPSAKKPSAKKPIEKKPATPTAAPPPRVTRSKRAAVEVEATTMNERCTRARAVAKFKKE